MPIYYYINSFLNLTKNLKYLKSLKYYFALIYSNKIFKLNYFFYIFFIFLSIRSGEFLSFKNESKKPKKLVKSFTIKSFIHFLNIIVFKFFKYLNNKIAFYKRLILLLVYLILIKRNIINNRMTSHDKVGIVDKSLNSFLLFYI
jgi:hypothetical protein